jgi:hypothetical protein
MEQNISKPVALLLTCTFLVVLSGVFLNDLVGGTYSKLLNENPPEAASLLDGSFARSTDEFLETRSTTMRSTRGAWNGFMLDWFSESPSEVCVGKDDFLFLRTSLQPVVEPTATRSWNDILIMLSTVSDATRAAGGKFRVLIMPAKWRIFEDKMRGRGPGPRRRALYSKAIQELHARGIDAPDLLAPLLAFQQSHQKELLYPPTDSHLSRLGFAHVTTHFVADLASVSLVEAQARLQRLPQSRSTYSGDLIRIMNIREDSDAGERFAFEERVHEAPACFDQQEAEILVLGDSFFRTYDGLFQRLIQVATQRTVDARFAGWGGLNIRQLAADYAQKPAPIVLIAITERLFATF